VNNGSLYSYGAANATDRALGSISSASYNNVTYGVRMVNDTPETFGSFLITYDGEQWRNGGPTPTAVQSLAFSYRIANAPITSPDWANAEVWTAVPTLNFDSPITGPSGSGGALDGNLPANRTSLSATVYLTLAPGEEVFFRWYDLNDPSADHGLGVDDLTIIAQVPEPSTALLGVLAALLLVRRRMMNPAV
jgi:hypothetical protein